MIRYYSVPKETFVTNGTIVEPLTATENGTYAPPAGTAYSPVIVNVEGGGGSSDFSTAEVTIVNNTGDSTSFDGCIIKNDSLNNTAVLDVDTNVLTVVLYKGSAYCGTYDIDMSTAVITGDAEYSSEENCFIITGDCTITIS